MKLLYINQAFFQSVQSLQNKHRIIGWKRTRNDGNSLYRAVMVKYLEKIFKIYAPADKLKAFIDMLSLIPESEENSILIEGRNELKKIIESAYIEKISRLDVSSVFIKLINQFQDVSFDKIIVMTGRLLAENALINNASMNTIPSRLNEILTLGNNCLEDEKYLLAIALNCNVIIYSFTENVVIEKIYQSSQATQETVKLVEWGYEYFILYDYQEFEIENYNFQRCSYCIRRNFEFYEKIHQALTSV